MSGPDKSANNWSKPIYWSFSGPDSWRMSVAQKSSAFVADPELFAELKKRSQPMAPGPKRVLFRQGDAPTGVYVVSKGSTMLATKSDGDVILNVQAGPGSVLGVPAVVGAKPYSLTAEAAEGAEISVLPAEDFVQLMQADSQLAFRVLQVLAAELRYARESLSHL